MTEKAVRLLKAATAKTLGGGLKWSEVASGVYSTVTAVPEGAILVWRLDREEDGRDDLAVSVTDRAGRVLAEGECADGEPEHNTLLALWQAARRAPSLNDAALDKMLESLSAK